MNSGLTVTGRNTSIYITYNVCSYKYVECVNDRSNEVWYIHTYCDKQSNEHITHCTCSMITQNKGLLTQLPALRRLIFASRHKNVVSNNLYISTSGNVYLLTIDGDQGPSWTPCLLGSLPSEGPQVHSPALRLAGWEVTSSPVSPAGSGS